MHELHHAWFRLRRYAATVDGQLPMLGHTLRSAGYSVSGGATSTAMACPTSDWCKQKMAGCTPGRLCLFGSSLATNRNSTSTTPTTNCGEKTTTGWAVGGNAGDVDGDGWTTLSVGLKNSSDTTVGGLRVFAKDLGDVVPINLAGGRPGLGEESSEMPAMPSPVAMSTAMATDILVGALRRKRRNGPTCSLGIRAPSRA